MSATPTETPQVEPPPEYSDQESEGVAQDLARPPPNSVFDDNGNPNNNESDEPLKPTETVKSPDGGPSSAKPAVNWPSFSKMQNSFEAYGDSRYFINAATLEGSGEGGERFLATSGTSVDGSALLTNSGPHQVRPTAFPEPIGSRNNQVFQDGAQVAQVVKPVRRSRVPVSKSFPDIIQIAYASPATGASGVVKRTMDKIQDEVENQPSNADSLEDIPGKTVWAGHDLLAAQNESAKALHQAGEGIPTSAEFSAPKVQLEDIMTQSTCQMGILSEKPPEAWVIDFNSLSMDAETLESHLEAAAAGRSSNSNSLAFFVNMDQIPERDVPGTEIAGKDELEQLADKKMFSMFVDIGSNQQQSDNDESLLTSSIMSDASVESHHQQRRSQLPKPSRLPVHKSVMSVLKDTESSPSSSRAASQMTCSTDSDKFFNGLGAGATAAKNGKLNNKRIPPNQYPSPRMQHKAAAEAALRALPLSTSSKNGRMPAAEDIACLESANLIDASIHSNRSSLHVATELDFTTSYISSMEMSGVIAEEPCSSGPCFKLGKDLLRMFTDGINTDVTIVVNGRCLEAHKCILSSRSQYFAAMFSGGSGDVVNLDGFTFNVVHFTMCHIYSGTNEVPDTIDLLELATLTDLLGLEGLRENISQTIRVKFCHNFHRPCTGCIAGVLECFPIAISCEMDDLQRKMTKWISKHFVRIWPTKAFASLGEDLIEKSLRYSVNHLSNDNILDITLGCDQLLSTMPSVRWTEPIFAIVNQLSGACVQFIGRNFSQVVQSKRFLLFGKGQQWNISRIESTFVEALELLSPDEACLSHSALSLLTALGTEAIDEVEWSTMFVDFVKMLSKEIERYLMANASKVVLSKYWESLSQEVRKRICTSSFLGYDKQGNKIAKPSGVSAAKSKNSADRPTSAEPHHHQQQQQAKGGKASASTTTSRPSSSKVQAEAVITNKAGRHHASNAKIASVKPIQNVLPSPQGSKPEPLEPAPLPLPATRTSNTTIVAPGAASRPRAAHHKNPTTAPRPTRVQKERSFTSSTRTTSVASSAAATPVNAVTPVDFRPGVGQQASSSTTSSITSDRGGTSGHSLTTAATSRRKGAAATKNVVPAADPVPDSGPSRTAKRFVTNSERANSVSKPTSVKPSRVQPKPALTLACGAEQYHSMERLDSNSMPEKPRYASRHGTTTGASTREPMTRKANVTSSGAPGSSSSRSTPRPRTKPTVVGNNTDGVASYQRTTAASVGKSNTRRAGGGKLSSVTNAARNHGSSSPSHSQPSSMSSSTTNIMSRSTIETDSGETKYRTLAQIGRSSTFSKDEPTVLGKIDPYTLDYP